MTARQELDEVVAGANRVTGLARVKAHLKRTGKWLVVADRKCRVCDREVADHSPPCRACGRPPEHHVPGDEALEWEGKARMAVARGRAGVPLTAVDREALVLFPSPTGWVGQVAS